MPRTVRQPAVDPATLPVREGTNYPAALAGPCAARRKRALGDAAGLSHFGVNLVELPPGTWSALRHWHEKEDEFVFVLEGEITLVTEGGEQVLGPGLAAGFPAGRADGHHLINRGSTTAVYLEVGDRAAAETVDYPDSDMRLARRGAERILTRRNGDPYPTDS
jgi:uncharacterized cupin superfamily protein